VLGIFACQHNPTRDEAAVAHTQVLNTWTAIHQVDLELCDIRDAGAKALSAVVEISPTLHRDPSARRAELSALEGPLEE
jgi:hypothetical protein